MIKLDDKALEYLKEKNLDLIVNLNSYTPGGWCSVPVRTVSVETRKGFEKPITFKKTEYEGINIYYHKGLKLKYDAKVYLKKKLLLLPARFGFGGIE